MKKAVDLRRKILFFIFAVSFAAFGLPGQSSGAQTKNAKKTSPSSKTQKSSAADKKDKKETGATRS